MSSPHDDSMEIPLGKCPHPTTGPIDVASHPTTDPVDDVAPIPTADPIDAASLPTTDPVDGVDPTPTTDPIGTTSHPTTDPVSDVAPNPSTEMAYTPSSSPPTEVMKSDFRRMWWRCLVPYQLVPEKNVIGFRRFVLTFVICLFPTAVAIYIFSAYGEGFSFLQWSQQHSALIPIIQLLLVAILAGMYLFDAERWAKTLRGRVLLFCSLGLTFALILALALVSAEMFPYGSLFLFVATFPLYLYAIKFFFYPFEKTRTYFSTLSGPLFVVSIVVTSAFFLSVVFMENTWTHTSRLEYFLRLDCVADFSLHPECEGDGNDSSCLALSDDENPILVYTTDSCSQNCEAIYDSCRHPFVLWAWPLMASMSLFFLSFVCAFVNGGHSSSGGAGAPMVFVKVWSVLFFLVWVVASLSGGAYSEGVINFLMAMFLAVGMIAVITFGRPKYGKVLAQRAEEGLGTNVDVAKAILVMTCTPVFIAYLGASVVNQRVRIIRRALRASMCPREPLSSEYSVDGVDSYNSTMRKPKQDGWENLWLTEIASEQLKAARGWEISKLIVWAVYLGIFFMVCFVFIGQFTTLLLSWVISVTADLNLAVVTLCMILVGLTMFLLPPVPGLPVYVAAGIVLVPSAEKSLGLFFATAYTCGVCLVMKLTACALQQKIIGESMSHWVSVRQAVNINSDFMRTFKLVLSDKGVSPAKVALLIGGPDWPTSVNCGLMRLPLIPILLGTLPIIFVIVPTVTTGTFMYLSQLPVDDDGKETYPWADTMTTFSMALSSGIQTVTFLFAATTIENALSERKADLSKIPIDEEVRDADERDKAHNEAYLRVTKWEILPIW
eukprot:CAMPEP_0194274418 /NCGR_PEP_ID=MMETSP0169-20130528/7496_1 /TAXON_ID=218684 /ORGANISM="Corethron pennatum, Strain L29A3" /LENGTH=833 /DNA_ID=CAMNT_0039017599 /DNA_START=146 /DNA_END=2644 /DNA_ORIENTATION=-